ncbi:hypothetical protein [Thalassospira lucentensis]|uniref:hypothetical protein n=1 Tax=Thalassospira lucentensis TaxID=168935 RepID=UPI002941E302|nr:hypothetical protein [Thalassospira lucentensis]WOI12845.1 hypothetical protein R1T41_09675 [Thalassospira lucentensis]
MAVTTFRHARQHRRFFITSSPAFDKQSDPGNAKTRQSASRLAGSVSGPICPVDFIFMPQTKEQIKNIFQKSSISVSGKNSRLFSINYAIILRYEGPVR